MNRSPLTFCASTMTVVCALTGALTPRAEHPLHAALFDLTLAFALVAFAGLWLTPTGPCSKEARNDC